MAVYTVLLRQLPTDTFASLLSDCGRKARESFFARHHIRAPKVAKTSFRSGEKNEVRASQLFASLQKVEDESLSEELLRQLFLRHRPLLSLALDTLKVPHEDGLSTADELSRFATLTDKDMQSLIDTLQKSKVDGHQLAPLYVPFMRAQMQAAAEESASA